jgi:CotH kinase protein
LQSAGDVGIRGRGSRSPDKPNLDVNMDKFVKKQRFTGLGFFVLKANNQDSSLMHEALAFELFRKMGLPGPREAPARLYVK